MQDKQEKTVVALYKRVSTVEQVREGYSMDAQDRTLTEHCRIKNYEIYKVYEDEGISAKDIIHRPGMQEMLGDAKERHFKKIVVYKLTRFSRNMANLMAVCEELDNIGIALESYSEAFDSTTPSGRMVRSILGTVAQFEREVIAENVAFGLAERAKQGKPTCPCVLGYDRIEKDIFIINETEAEYVRFAGEYYLFCKSLSETAAEACRRGYKGKKGRQPTPQAVFVIISNPFYVGYNRFHGILYKGSHEPIYSMEMYKRILRQLRIQGKVIGRTRINDLPYI